MPIPNHHAPCIVQDRARAKNVKTPSDIFRAVPSPSQDDAMTRRSIIHSFTSIIMVYYFKSRCGEYTIYMGKDKYENEDLSE